MHGVIAKNTFFQAIARVVTSLITLIITILIARTFGVVGYGDFTKIITYVGLFYLVVDFGLNALFLQKGKVGSFRDLLYLRILIAIFLIVLANGIALVLPFQENLQLGFSSLVRTGILIFSFSLLIQAIIFSASAIFQGKQRYDLLLISQTIGSFVTLFLILLFTSLSLPLQYVLFAFIMGGIVAGIIALFLTREKIVPISMHIPFAKKLLKESLPLAGMLVFNLIYFRIDMILLSVFRPTADVGIYGMSMRFFDFLIALPLFLSNSLYPVIVERIKNNRSAERVLKTYLLLSFVFSIGLIIVFWFAAPLLTLIAKDFSFSTTPFRILLISLPFFFATSLLQWTLIAHKKQMFLLTVYLIAAVMNIVLNLIFIPIGSYIAASIITGVCEAFVLLILTYQVFVRKFFER